MISQIINKKNIKKVAELILFARSPDGSSAPALHPFTLKFIGKDSFLEEEFQVFFKRSLRSQTIFSHFLGLLFYAGFSFLDLVLTPDFAGAFIFIRLVIIVPLIVISTVLVITDVTRRFLQLHLALIMIIVGSGIIAMTAIGGPHVNSLYYPGIILVFIFAFTFVGLRFVWATFSTMTTVLIYEAVAVFYSHVPLVMLIGNNFFLISTLMFSMIAGYAIEYYRRSEFFTNRLLELERERIELSNIELERRVKKRTVELYDAKEKAEKSDKLKSIFLAQMSHEIRTPINAILSLTSLIEDDLKDQVDEETKLSFGLVNRAGYRIIRTVDLLLNLSEIQAGTYEVIPVRLDLYADILGKIAVYFKKEAKSRGLKLEISIETENTEIVADSYTVEQIFTQLVENAIKYTDKGKVTIKLYRCEKGRLVVDVIDTGIGISEEYLSELFQPFTQEEMGYTRKYEGNGIGLALVQKYCELNNAEIEVESKKNQGSLFRVKFNN
ncbi:MAG: hypothetical protein GXO87_04100 [Chlorobi bacterium]|nr:hypothetical protein [Chlorobiota bacterium]